MSIELHCPACSKVIRAPEGAGGKKGKCPYCQSMVYIPAPAAEEELIPIVPIDPEEETREAELRREAANYAASIDKAADSQGGQRAKGERPRPPSDSAGNVDVAAEVVTFLEAMRDSQLDRADGAVGRLKQAGQRAKDHVQGMLVDQMPPAIDNVPPPLLHGFLKMLLGRLD